jgi:hypothetical protein
MLLHKQVFSRVVSFKDVSPFSSQNGSLVIPPIITVARQDLSFISL